MEEMPAKKYVTSKCQMVEMFDFVLSKPKRRLNNETTTVINPKTYYKSQITPRKYNLENNLNNILTVIFYNF